MDFMADELFDGRRLRLLTIVDNFSRVSPFIGVGYSYKGYDVVSALNLAVAQYGVPECIRVDNGPEFISKEVDLWAYAHGVVLDFSRPGKPTRSPAGKQKPGSRPSAPPGFFVPGLRQWQAQH